MNSPVLDSIVTGIQTLEADDAQQSAQVSADAAQIAVETAEVQDLNQKLSDETAAYALETQQLSDAEVQIIALKKSNDDFAQLLAAAQVKLAAEIDPQVAVTGVTVFAALHTHKRSPQVVGTTVNQDQEIMLQWGDAGGTKADSNPGTVVKPHGTAVFVPGTATTPAHIAFNPAAANDNEFLFMPLPTPSAAPKLFYSLRIYQCTPAEAVALTCPESDSQYIGAGWVYNFGTQLHPTGWRFFRYGTPGDWELFPGIPMVDFVTKSVRFEVISSIDTVAHTVTRVAIRINGGPWIPIGLTLPAFNTGNAALYKYTCAIQLDTKGAPAGALPPATGMSILDVEERYL